MFAKQIFVVNGVLFGTDEFEPIPYPLQGANIEVKCVGDTTQVFGGTTNKDGEFLIPVFLRQRLKSNQLRIRISYVGMDGIDKVFNPKEVKLLGQKVYQVDFDSLVLKSNPMTLAEAEVIGELRKMYQSGDTVIFNADAYEMPSGSVLLDLVRRLPGLQYVGGKLTYMNRDIEEIRLNGDNFFKRDMSVALQNMPHDKLKSLRVYEVPDDTLNVMSEQHLVMDMTTKDKTNRVMFANAGVGVTGKFDRFSLNGNFSRWKKGGGQFKVHFNTSTIPNGMSEKEVRTATGASYEQQLGKTKVEGIFDYGYNNTVTHESSYNRIFMPAHTQNSNSDVMSGTRSRSYKGNVRLDGQLGKDTHWNMHVDFTKSRDHGWRSSTDSIFTDDVAVSSTQITNTSRTDHTDFTWKGGLKQYWGENRSNEAGLTAVFDYGDAKSLSTNDTYTHFYMFGDSVRKVNHVIDNPSKRTHVDGKVYYRHAFGSYTNLGVNYEVGYERNTNSQTYSDASGVGLQPIDSLHYDNKYMDKSHGPSVDLKYDNKKVLFQFVGKALPTVRTADNVQYVGADHNSYSSVQYLANARIELKLNKEKDKLTIRYNGSNTLPSPSDISTTIDYSNPMNIRRGNPNLKEAFSHNISVEYQYNTLFRVSSNYNRTDDQQTTLSLIDHTTGVRTSMPTNINGNWRSSSYVFVTKPVGDVTLAALGNYTYNHSVSYVQDATAALPVKSPSNWKRVDASVYATYSNNSLMMILRGNYSLDCNKNEYFATATKGQLAGATLNLEYTLPLKVNIKLKTDFNFNSKFGYELASANRNEYIWNASAEYKFLGIVTASLEWRDILRSQRGFTASMTGTGWSENQQYGKTSMVLLRVSVKLNGLH